MTIKIYTHGIGQDYAKCGHTERVTDHLDAMGYPDMEIDGGLCPICHPPLDAAPIAPTPRDIARSAGYRGPDIDSIAYLIRRAT